jgi:hypothetical protein
MEGAVDAVGGTGTALAKNIRKAEPWTTGTDEPVNRDKPLQQPTTSGQTRIR